MPTAELRTKHSTAIRFRNFQRRHLNALARARAARVNYITSGRGRIAATVRNVRLITSYDQQTDMAGLQEKLDELKQSLLEYDIALDVHLNDKMHDREVRLDNGWIVKIGRGLDFYQKPEGWFAVGATDLSLRRCLETKVDVFRNLKRVSVVS